MQRSSVDEENSSDPIDYLVVCALEDLKILDTIDPNELIDKIEDKTENDSRISIDADDLKEWFDEKSCESILLDDDANDALMEHGLTPNDTGAHQDLQNVDRIKHRDESINDHSFKQESLESMRKINQIALKDGRKNGSSNQEKLDSAGKLLKTWRNETNFSLKDEPTNTNSLQKRLDSMAKTLETTMLRTHLSCGLVLKKNESAHTSMSMDPPPLRKVRDLMSGKRKYLTAALEESRKNLGSFKPTLPFARGKQKSLTEKIKESQHRLQILRSQSEILTKDKPFAKKRRSLVELDNSLERKKNLMCNQPKLEMSKKVPGLPPIEPIESIARKA